MQKSLLVLTAAVLLCFGNAVLAEASNNSPPPNPLSGIKRIVFTGDSLTDGSA